MQARAHAIGDQVTRQLEKSLSRKDIRIGAAPLSLRPWLNALPPEERLRVCRALDRMEKQLGSCHPPVALGTAKNLEEATRDPLQRYALQNFAERALKDCPSNQRKDVAILCGQIASHLPKQDARALLEQVQKRVREHSQLALESYRLSWAEKSERGELKQRFDQNRDGYLQPHEIEFMRDERARRHETAPER